MRLPVEHSISLSSLFPSLGEHGSLKATQCDSTAAGYARSYQRARRRSHCRRGITGKFSGDWEESHLPFDLFSYHLTTHTKNLFNCAQQLRFFYEDENHHDDVILHMISEGMLAPEAADKILDQLEQEKCEKFSQIGGWLARVGYSARNAAFMPCYCIALNRILGIPFGYAICRVENGAAQFLQRMGSFPIGAEFHLDFYGGTVQVIGCRAYDVSPRFEPLVQAAQERLQQGSKVFLGTLPSSALSTATWTRSQKIPLGGSWVDDS